MKSLEHKLELVIREPLTNNISSLSQEDSAKITICYCMNQGPTTLSASFEKNAYMPGEKAIVTCEIDNKRCEKPIENVIFVLKK